MFSGHFNRAIKRLQVLFLEILYGLHLRIRFGHDYVYNKSKVYKRYSDSPASKVIHRSAFMAFVASFMFFTIIQYALPGFFSIKDVNKAYAANIFNSWSTQADFTNNNSRTASTYKNQVDIATNGSVKLGGTRNLGTGIDGNLVVSAPYNITTNSAPGRILPDAVNYVATGTVSLGSSQITLSTAPNGIVANDEVLVINLKGAFGDSANVGNYEYKKISLVSGNTLTFDTSLTKDYGNTTGQKIMVQRVPQYQSLTINWGGSMTSSAWDGVKGGVFAIKVKTAMTMGTSRTGATGRATIDMDGKGFRGGAMTNNTVYPMSGESYYGGFYTSDGVIPSNIGLGAGSPFLNNGAYADPGGGAGYGDNTPDINTAPPTKGGLAYGDTSQLTNKAYLGSGGGGSSTGGNTSRGLNGGGIVMIDADQVSLTSNSNFGPQYECGISPVKYCNDDWSDYASIHSNGEARWPGVNGGVVGGGGTGGSVVLKVASFANNSPSYIAATGTVRAGFSSSAGSVGRIYVSYGTKSGVDPSPAPFYNQSGSFYNNGNIGGDAGLIGLRADNATEPAKWQSLGWGVSFPVGSNAQYAVKFKIRGANTVGSLTTAAWYGPDGQITNATDWTASGKWFGSVNGAETTRALPGVLTDYKYIDIFVYISSDTYNTPTLSSVSVGYLMNPIGSDKLKVFRQDNGVELNQGYTNQTQAVLKVESVYGLSDSTNIYAQFEVKVANGTFNGSGTIDGTVVPPGGTSIQTITLPNATAVGNKWRTRLIDNSGNTSDWTNAPTNIVVDQAIPVAASLTEPLNNSYKTITPTFTWGAATDVLAGINYYELWLDGAKNIDAPANMANNIFTKTITTPLTQAPHTWLIRAYDRAGNYTDSASRVVNVDNTPPTYTLQANGAVIQSLGYQKDADTISITANFSENVQTSPTISITYSGGSGSDITGAAMTMSGNASTWTYPVNVPSGHDGLATISIAAIDIAGNSLAVQATNKTFNVDNILPTVSSAINPAAPLGGLNYYLVAPVISVTSADTGSTVEKIQYKWTAAADTNLDVGQIDVPGTGATIDMLATKGQGSWYLNYRSVDYAGNKGVVTSTFLKLDTQDPQNTAITINGGTEFTQATNLLSVSLNIVSEDTISGIRDYRISNDNATWTGWTPWDGVSKNISNFDLSSLGGNTDNGNKTIYLEVADNSGRISAVTKTIIYDDIAPNNIYSSSVDTFTGNSMVVPISPNVWKPYKSIYVTWPEVTDNINSEPDLSGIRGYNYWYCYSADNANCVAKTLQVGPTNTAFPYDLTALAQGKYYFKIAAVDFAGNESPTPATFLYKMDYTKPDWVSNFQFDANFSGKLTDIRVTWDSYVEPGSGSTKAPIQNYRVERVKYSYYTNPANNMNMDASWASAGAGNGYASFENIASDRTEFVDSTVTQKEGQILLIPSIKYIYKVSVKDESNSAYGDYYDHSGLPTLILGETLDTNPPENLGGLAAVACDGTAPKCSVTNKKGFETKLTWHETIDYGVGVVGYKVYRSESNFFPDQSDYGNRAITGDWTLVGNVPGVNSDNTIVFYDNNDAKATRPVNAPLVNDYSRYFYRVTAYDLNYNPADTATFVNESYLFQLGGNDANATTEDMTDPNTPVVSARGTGIDSRPPSQLRNDPEPQLHQRVRITWSIPVDDKSLTPGECTNAPFPGEIVLGQPYDPECGSGVKEYRIYRLNPASGLYNELLMNSAMPDGTILTCSLSGSPSCENDGLEDTIDYYYKIIATDAAGNDSVLSAEAKATTYSSAIPTQPVVISVTVQKDKQVSGYGTTASIKFKGSKAPKCDINTRIQCIVKYEVYRSTQVPGNETDDEWIAGATKLPNDIVINPPAYDQSSTTLPSGSLIDTGLSEATTYYYRVRAQDNTLPPQNNPTQGNYFSPMSQPDFNTLYKGWDTTPDITAPDPTRSLAATVKAKDIWGASDMKRSIVTWQIIPNSTRTFNGNTVNDFREYRIYRKVNSGGWSQIAVPGPNNTQINPLYKTDLNESIRTNYYIDEIKDTDVLCVNILTSCDVSYYVTAVDNADDNTRGFKYTAPNGSITVNPPGTANESSAPVNATTGTIPYNPYTAVPSIVKFKNVEPGANVGDSIKAVVRDVGVTSATIQWYADQTVDSVVEYRKSNPANGEENKWITSGDRMVHPTSEKHDVRLVGLQPNTEYSYRVISRNYLGNEGSAEGSEVERLITGSFSIVDSSPKSVTTTTGVEISWKTNLDASSAFIEYQMNKQPGDESQGKTVGVNPEDIVSKPKDHKVAFNGLKSSRTYTYKIKSISKDGFTAESALLSFSTKAFDTTQFTLTPSSSNVAERQITSTTAQIVWQTATSTTSWVDYSTTSGKYDNSAGDNNLNTQHAVQIEGLVPGTKYFYRVRAKDGNDIEYTSQEYSFVAVLKPKISNMRVKDVTPYTVTISWDTNVDTETVINWGQTAEYGEKKGISGVSKVHELKIDNLTDNQEYHYQILAKDETGNEVADDDKVIRTPLDIEGPKIENVKLDVLPMGESDNTGQVIISWTTNKPATGLIEYDEGVIGGKYAQQSIEDLSLNTSHTVIVKELKPATSYHYRIVSKDKRNNASVSQDYTFVTPTKEKSILQLIIKSLEETFSWTRNLGQFFNGISKRFSGK